ncbi:MAG TPA: SpoIIE family protein phosphatase [Nocardioidaceae bacterium]
MLASHDEDGRRLLMLADLLENLPTAVAYLAGPEFTFELANGAYRRLVGGRDVVGKPVREALPEIEGQGYFELLDEVRTSARSREGREAELRVQNAEGDLQRVFVDFLYEPVQDGEGAVVGILVDAKDVTQHVLDRRRLEELAGELTEAQERYRTLFETMLLGVVYHDATGTIVAANPAAGEVLGVDPADLVGLSPQSPQWQAVREDESPFPGDEHPAMVALRTGSVVTGTVMGVVHGRSGERRWLTVTAVPDARDERGRPQRVYAMFEDVTDERRAAAALRERDSLLGRLRDANVLGIVLADEERVVDANDAFLEIIGYDRQQLDDGLVDWRAITPQEWAPADQRALDELRSKGSCVPFEKEYVAASGERVPVMLGAAVVDRDPLRWVTFVADLSDRQRAEEERARLLTAAQTAQTEAAHARERLGLLLRAGAALAATRDREDLLRHLTRLLVPAVADFATVFVPTDDGSLRAVVNEHRDPTKLEALDRLAEQPVAPDSRSGAQQAYRTGRTQLMRDVQASAARWPDADAAVRELVDELGTDSAITVPLTDGATISGVLSLGRTAERPAFAESDVAVAEELGRRLATALTNADVIAREHTVAEMLQRSLLPDVLPRMPGLDLAVVYLPATEGVDVGGDWYDAFPLGEGRIGIALGDVVGHNLTSATTMNQVRNALRAYAVDDDDPASVLSRTNTALVRLLPEAMATVFYGVVDVPGRELRFASAGHPPPLLAEGGKPRFLGEGGLMLGVDEDARFATTTISWPDETALLLYSDGLVEDRRRPIDEGFDDIAAAFTGATVRSAEEMCATVRARLLATPDQEDDVCLLAVRLTDPGQPGSSGPR